MSTTLLSTIPHLPPILAFPPMKVRFSLSVTALFVTTMAQLFHPGNTQFLKGSYDEGGLFRDRWSQGTLSPHWLQELYSELCSQQPIPPACEDLFR